MTITLDEIQTHAPQDVKLILMDETEVDVEIEFQEVDEKGVFSYKIIVPEELENTEFKSFTVGVFPSMSGLAFPELHGM